MEKLKNIIANNLIFYRKNAKLTQLELAEKLNYSDKAISKWECAETIPDIYILTQLAEIYGITVNDIISEKTPIMPKIKSKKLPNKVFVSLLSTGLVWLIATICFVVLKLLNFDFAWLSFIFALPVNAIILTIFSALWFNKLCTAIFTSMLIWLTFLAIYLALNQSAFWLLFLISIPLQVLTILWFIYKSKILKK